MIYRSCLLSVRSVRRPASSSFVRYLSAVTPPEQPTPPPTAAELAEKRRQAKTMNWLMKIGCVAVVLGCARFYYSELFQPPVSHQDIEEEDPAATAATATSTSAVPVRRPQTKRNPVVYLDISIDDQPAGRIFIRLRGDIAPDTAENFLDMCQNSHPWRTLQNTGFHRAVSGAFIQGGLLASPSQAGAEYQVGESFELQPDGPYWVGMAETPSSPDPNHSQFFITTNAVPSLAGKHVIFGRVIEGYSVVHAIENRFNLAGGASTSIRITRAAPVDSEARMEFIRGSLHPASQHLPTVTPHISIGTPSTSPTIVTPLQRV